MKIVFIIPRLHQGGSQRQIAETAKIMKLHGHDVSMLVFNLKGQHFFLEKDNISIIQLNPANLWTRCLSLYYALKNAEADFAIAFLEKANLCLGLVGLFSNLRKHTFFIGSERNNVLRYSHSIFVRTFFRMAYLGIDALLTNSDQAVPHILSCLSWKTRQIFVLPNVVNFDQFHPLSQTKAQLISTVTTSLCPNDFIILVPARICKQKNQRILLKIAQSLRYQEDIRFRFVLAGSERGSYAQTLINDVEKLGLSQYFNFLGPVPENTMISLYCAADLVLLPSLYEGLPNAVLESMACGAVTVASNTANVETLIHSGENGYTVPPNDPEIIADTIRYVADMSEERRCLMGKKAYETVLPFRPEMYANKFTNILFSIKSKGYVPEISDPQNSL